MTAVRGGAMEVSRHLTEVFPIHGGTSVSLTNTVHGGVIRYLR